MFVVLCVVVFFFIFIFFFQAEDGIRDLVRSRGLGDVYKRQAFLDGLTPAEMLEDGGLDQAFDGQAQGERHFGNGAAPVSYTHLTLPTSDLV